MGRKTRRRSGYRSEQDARHALELVLAAERIGVFEDPKITVGAYLLEWLALKEMTLKASTYANYHAYVHKDLLPTFRRIRLVDLKARHIEKWSTDQLSAERGPVAVYRAGSVPRSALGQAVRGKRLTYNPARRAVRARPASPERLCWTSLQAAGSLATTPRITRISSGTCSR
ncbi:N-terminal phage integrase SAM-like domain-containing protein [Streptomyces sp. 1114.5]|uniref:N-terminal phage integrase SAM-like domain-containing protein n=1 Tax=Streptomyces sp. 1114.5 TaxID=1938830 RepID=UPI00160016C0|nr:N-terminal phage integrase SAM-like domain-containing protein [Streptomyces sp. 1114.5]